ncbi:MAG: PEP-CTERM sorting domain-containing protein [Lentisphaerae bacterium]|nr:PEP-CTERM sorting domain-containing protein [Lentisphaerota bacterium]
MNERIETPRPLTHAESDFPSVRGNRSQAVISRGRIRLVYAVVAVVLLAPGVSSALPTSATDFWDMSQGSVVDSHTGVLYNNDIRNMFGGSFGTLGPNVLFADGRGAGYVHTVEWHTPAPVTLRSFSLWANNEDTMLRRAFNRFTLYSGSASSPSDLVYDTGPGYSYLNTVNLEQDVTPVTAQYFKAEFVQAPYTYANASGPRVLELDGFDTYLDGTPEPATLSLLALGGLVILRRRRK